MGTCHYLRDTFFRKSAELFVSISEICAEFWVPFEEKCRIMGTIMDTYYKINIRETWHSHTGYPSRN